MFYDLFHSNKIFLFFAFFKGEEGEALGSHNDTFADECERKWITCHKTFTERKDEYSRNVAAFKNGGTSEHHHSDIKCASTNKSTCNNDERSVFSNQQGPRDDSSNRQSSLHTHFTELSDITVCFMYKNLSIQYICDSMILTKWCYFLNTYFSRGVQ